MFYALEILLASTKHFFKAFYFFLNKIPEENFPKRLTVVKNLWVVRLQDHFSLPFFFIIISKFYS